MRNVVLAIALALGTLLVAVALGLLIADGQPRYSAQLRNAYWPYSVEASVRDR